MKFIKNINISKFAFEVVENEKKKYLNSKYRINNCMLIEIAILKLYSPEKLLILSNLKEYKELIDVYQK